MKRNILIELGKLGIVFSLMAIGMVYLNSRMDAMEEKYEECNSARIDDLKNLRVNYTNHEKEKQTQAANAKIFPEVTERNDRNGGSRNRLVNSSCILAGNSDNSSRLRHRHWHSGRGNIPID